MDALSEDAQSIKIPALSLQEGTKKKKQSRKKTENKQPKPESEVPEVIPELNNDLDSDLVVYTYKLEAELAAAKKKLKSQRQKFRHLIDCLSKNIDAKGITANIVEEYLQTLNTRLSDVDTESQFEKFFTTHKYRILEESSDHQHDHSLHKEGPNKKTSSKSVTNMLKNSVTTDKTPSNGDALNSQSPHEGPQNGTGTKKPKKEKAAKTNGEGEAKKRKPKKHKESDDMSEDVVEILEIPPPKAKPKKDDNTKAIQQQQQQQQQQIPPLQTNNILEDGLKTLMQVGMDPTALMNAYLMAGQGIPGMSEADLAMYMNKTLQDLMKMGTHNPGRGGDQSANDMLNYYQRNFQ